MRKTITIINLIFLPLLLFSCTSDVTEENGFYPTYVFTHSEIVLFGYNDDTSLTVKEVSGETIWDGKLDAGEHKVLRPDKGVYSVVGDQPYATLTGDAIDGTVMGYYAIDEQGRGASTLFHTYQSSSANTLFGLVEMIESAFVIFAYEDGTAVTLKESGTNSVIWQGTLNEGDAHFETEVDKLFLTVEADQPVSVLSYTDQGYYVPAKNGRFIGKQFYTWAGDAGDWIHDLNLIAYTDDSNITVTDTQTGETLWQGVLSDGEIYVVTDVNGRQLTINSSQDIAVSISPSVSYDNQYAHMIFAQDETGSGIGTRFLYPTIGNARLEIFAYEDNTSIEARDSAGNIAYQGVLNQGESTAFDSSKTLYTITADHPVSALMDWGNQAGAEFAPPYYTAPTAAIITMPEPSMPPWLPFVLIPLLVLLAIAGGYYYWRSRQQPVSRRRSGSTGGSGRVSPPPSSRGGYAPSSPPQPKKPRGSNVSHGRGKK